MTKRWTGLGCLLFFCLDCDAQLGKPRPDSIAPISIKTVPPDFYTRRLSFFCRTEWSLQKATGRPVFLRLGSKEYVDYLEQKPGAKRP
ncbi:hypothetical protein [Flaviaesturariibacter aridisoli]|uniref:Uncharacterized protein n=1 Tax=Flaviaesturariibacter aridisoli TaxID=2545761 RepID=A0A4R4DS97_9BACT|nr:hypothetical protein [Flaviaesturariibacter aridisoli]TCZ63404.1 hypothetical protein E0486_18580 [Flaviaesturariibacter aridisoli]